MTLYSESTKRLWFCSLFCMCEGEIIMYSQAKTVGGTWEKPKVKKRWIRHDKKQEGKKKLERRSGRSGDGETQEEDLIKKKRVFSLPGVKLSLWLSSICCPTSPLWPYIKPRASKRHEQRLLINISPDTILPPSPLPCLLHLCRADTLTLAVCFLKIKPSSLEY